MRHLIAWPFDSCEHRHEIARETDVPLDCAACDLPPVLRSDFCERRTEPPGLAEKILEIARATRARVFGRVGFDHVLKMYLPDATDEELAAVFWGLNLIEELVARSQTDVADTGNSDHGEGDHGP